ncbi:hypothetical protein [Arcanobacterium haemolyticum]
MTLVFNERNHRYKLDGKPVQGVTTIIGGGLPKPQLMYWAAKTVAEEAINNISVWADRAINEPTDRLIGELKKAHMKERDKAAVRGSEVHGLAENLITTGEIALTQGQESLLPWVQNYADLLEKYDIKPLLAEAQLASRDHWYAGTADLIAKIGEETWLLDLKTSKSIYGSYALQCAAYAKAEFYLDEHGDEKPLPHIEKIGVIHLGETFSLLHPFPDFEGAWEAFLAVKKVNDLIKTIDKYGEPQWPMK